MVRPTASLLCLAAAALVAPAADLDFDGPPAEKRKEMVARLGKQAKEARADLEAQLKRAKAGQVTPLGTKKTFIPASKSQPIRYPSQSAKDELVGQIEERLAALRKDPSGFAPLVAGPVKVGAFGRIGQVEVTQVTSNNSLRFRPFTPPNQQPEREAIATGIDTTNLLNDRTQDIPGLFYVRVLNDGRERYFHFVRVKLSADELASIAGE